MGSMGLLVVTLSIGAAPHLTPPTTPTAPAPLPTAAEVRASVERGLPYLEKAGQAWLTGSKCIACHHGAFMVWSHNEARQRGFAVDAKKLDDMNKQVLTMFLNDRADFEKNKTGQVRGSGVILAQAGTAPADDKTAEALREARSFILKRQQENGSWKFVGQIQERPGAEADETTTMWAVLALAALKDQDEEIVAARKRAQDWLAKNQTGKGNEALVLRILLEQKFGEAERARAMLDELVSRQNADGGWSWSPTRKSDPFATGQSLYVLGTLGRGGEDPAVQRAWRYLLGLQKADGSWLAPTKKDSGASAISSYWGSAWAVMGLVKTLPMKAE